MLPGSTFSQQGLAQEIQKVRDFYFRYGYMNVQIAQAIYSFGPNNTEKRNKKLVM